MSPLFWISYVVLWALVAVQGFALLEVVRQLTQLRNRQLADDGPLIVARAPGLGADVPATPLASLASTGDLRLDAMLPTQVGVFVLLSVTCATCRSLALELNEVMATDTGAVPIVVVLEAKTREEGMRFVGDTRLDPSRVLWDAEGTVAAQLELRWKPAAFTIQDGSCRDVAVIRNVSHVEGLRAHVMKSGDEHVGSNASGGPYRNRPVDQGRI